MDFKAFIRKNIYLIGALFVFLLFRSISIKTPLAGDDWGYALSGMKENPFLSAIEFYSTWSGRFFSELYGFLVTPRKELWNILNPALFTGIYLCLYKLVNKKSYLLITLLIIVSILSVENNVRMETYTWLMGTTYVIPLFLSLLYLVMVDICFNKETKFNKYLLLISNIFLFVIGLMMENIAATMIVGTIILAIYSYFNKRDLFKYFIINVIVSILSFTIMRLSPGSAYRLIRDNAEWASLSILGKMAYGYPSFIKMTFISHKYMIVLLSLSTVLLAIKKIKKNIIIVSVVLINMLSVATVFLGPKVNIEFLVNSNSVYSMVYWPIYTICNLLVIYFCIDDKYERNKLLFLFALAGTSTLSMLLSPLFGYRSSIYLIYFMIIVYVSIFNLVIDNKYINIGFCLLLLFVIYNKYNYYNDLYINVESLTEQRNIKLEYYRSHPEDTEVWLERYPLNTIHGADIDPDDTYHFEVFKEYYNLPQDSDKIYFYLPEGE